MSSSKKVAWATGGLLCLGLLAARLATAAMPNVVFIHSDDHGWGDVGFHGSQIDTPNIDAIAAGGVSIDRYHTQPICGPTRVGLMTGRNPVRMGVYGNFETGEDGVPLDEHFLSESFHAAGYQTWALGKWHLGGTTSPDYLPPSRGFDHFYGFVGGSINESTHMTPSTTDLDWQRNGAPVVESGLSTDLLATEAVSLIQGRDPARPFFLYLAFHAVHTPYDAPQELKDKYAALGMSGQQLQYSAMVENMDINVGRVLDALDAQGLAANTIVVFASDNGADDAKGGSNLPLRGWKGEIFEGGNRTPAAIRWPGVVPEGVASSQFLSHQDWFPTLAAAAGVPVLATKPLDGRDRWQAIVGGGSGDPRAYVVRRGQGTSVMDGQWKLLRQTSGGPWELYDLSVDPGETTDLAAAYPAIVSELAAYVDMLENGTDDDADLVPDDEDECNTLVHRGTPSSPPDQNPSVFRLTLSRLDQGAGEQRVVAKGYFNPAVDTPAIDPSVHGARVLVRDDSGELLDVSVPGGAEGSSPCDPSDGWRTVVTASATKWMYRNVSGGLPDGLGGCVDGAANGLTRVLVSDLTAGSKASYSFRVSAKGADFDVAPSAPLTELQFDFVPGEAGPGGSASAEAQAGQCAEFRVSGSPVRSAGTKPYCRSLPDTGATATIKCTGA